jgi:hypothetical protein
MKVRFLLDENMSPGIISGVLRHNGSVDILRIGDPDAPPLGTPDPDILRNCEVAQRLLITDNRSTMPEHSKRHLDAGRHHWGVLKTSSQALPIGQIISDQILIWEASEAEEYVDRADWLPL